MGKGAKRKGKHFKRDTSRKKQVEEVFKKGRTQRQISKRLDEKLARKHLKASNTKLSHTLTHKKTKGHIDILDKKLAYTKQVRKPSQNRKVGPMAINSAIDCFEKMQINR